MQYVGLINLYIYICVPSFWFDSRNLILNIVFSVVFASHFYGALCESRGVQCYPDSDTRGREGGRQCGTVVVDYMGCLFF